MAKVFDCKDLDTTIDFSKETLTETQQLVEEIFFHQIELGKQIDDMFLRELFAREVNKVYHNHKTEIVFCLKGELSFRQRMDIILSFF